VTWTSSNPLAAVVSSTGLLSGVALGPATITATVDGKEASVNVSICAAVVASVTITPLNQSLTAGLSLQLEATVRDAAGNVLTGRPVTWSSSNPLFASVSNTGLLSALLVGNTTITATSEGKSGTLTVPIVAAILP
jgi:uncharacterized protein YjdB